MKKNRYFCTSCRKQIKNLQQLLFVDDFSVRGFCCEQCILDFFAPQIDEFYAQEALIRTQQQIPAGPMLATEDQNRIFQQLIESPQEIWMDRNDLGESYFTYISYHSDLQLYASMVCFQYEGEVSFIFYKTLTTSPKLLEWLRSGQQVNTSKTFQQTESPVANMSQEVELPGEVMEELEQKKSSYLASLLQYRAGHDIAYDQFMEYERFLPLTLEDPDEVYDHQNEDADEISTFIKTFQVAGGTFFYVVVCWKCTIKSFQEQMLIPILSFPSVDQQLYQEFAIGERVVGRLKS